MDHTRTSREQVSPMGTTRANLLCGALVSEAAIVCSMKKRIESRKPMPIALEIEPTVRRLSGASAK